MKPMKRKYDARAFVVVPVLIVLALIAPRAAAQPGPDTSYHGSLDRGKTDILDDPQSARPAINMNDADSTSSSSDLADKSSVSFKSGTEAVNDANARHNADAANQPAPATGR